MALRRFPPLISHRYKSYFVLIWLRKRFSILLALPRPKWISPPECPPFRPFTSTLKKKYPAGTSTSLYVNSATESIPPAHPINSSPSSSESRFNRISPFINPSFRANAPVSPVSSSTVNKHSNGPCSIVSSARIASSVATPMPLSAPNVVPFAFSHSPSISVSIGSVRKSCSTLLFFSHTMSTCDCNTTVCRFSLPGVAGFLINTFPASSTLVSRLCFSPNAFKYAIIFSSFFEGRLLALVLVFPFFFFLFKWMIQI